MRGAVAVASREMWERRMVMFVALGAGLMPFAVPWLPGVSTDNRWSTIVGSAVILAIAFGTILAVSLGATVVGRDLANRRLGFDLTRPIGTLAVWAGRLGAAVALTAATMAIILGPAILIGLALRGRQLFGDESMLVWVALMASGLLLIVPLAHIVGVICRSRSRWLVFDVAAACGIAAVAAWAARHLLDASASSALVTLTQVGVATSIPILWIASAAQILRGRVDLVAGHRAQALVLWPLLAVLVLGFAAYSTRFAAVGPTDLVDRLTVRGSSAGSWFAVTGAATDRDDYRPTFLLDADADADAGRSIRVGENTWVDGETLFSGDGRRAAWIQRIADGTSNVTVRRIELTADEPQPRTSRIQFSALMSPISAALSPTGRFLAGVQHDTLAVHDLDLGRTVVSRRLPAAIKVGQTSLAFLSERVLRVYCSDTGSITAYELDLDSRQLRRFESEAGTGDWVHWTPDHDRLLLIDGWGRRATILEGTDGATLWHLPDADTGTVRSVDFLADGRVVAAVAGGGAVPVLLIYSPDGELVHRIEFDGVADIPALGFEISPGRFLVGYATRDDNARWIDRRLYAVDAESGESVRVEGTDALPFRTIPSAGWSPPRPGSAASRLLAGSECGVVLIDPDDLSTRSILGGACS